MNEEQPEQEREEARKHWQDWNWDNEINAREGL